MKTYPIFLSAILLVGCSSAGGPVNLRGDAWQVTAVDNTAFVAVDFGYGSAQPCRRNCQRKGRTYPARAGEAL